MEHYFEYLPETKTIELMPNGLRVAKWDHSRGYWLPDLDEEIPDSIKISVVLNLTKKENKCEPDGEKLAGILFDMRQLEEAEPVYAMHLTGKGTKAEIIIAVHDLLKHMVKLNDEKLPLTWKDETLCTVISEP